MMEGCRFMLGSPETGAAMNCAVGELSGMTCCTFWEPGTCSMASGVLLEGVMVPG